MVLRRIQNLILNFIEKIFIFANKSRIMKTFKIHHN